MYILAPSILAADFGNLRKEIETVSEAGAQYIHIDVMDGMFVPSISFGMPVLKSIHNATDQVMDAHLMVQEPIRYVEAFKEAGADIVTIHLEACEDVNATIAKIRECGMKVGLSICPETPVSKVENLLKDIDMLLIMSVHPGFGGQKLIPYTVEKVRALKKMIDERGLKTDIEVDGGVNLENVTEVMDAGANIIVAGSAVFKGDIAENVERFLDVLKE